MVDIPPATSASSSSSSAPAAPAGNVTAVEASVSALPEKIQQLLRQVQVSGTIAQPPDANSITLNTMLGNITLQLPQLVNTQKQLLLQQLLNLFQSQRPITVVVTPGNPPTQAFLLLPPAGTQAQSQTPLPGNIQQAPAFGTAPALVPLQTNSLLTAIVLPGLSDMQAQTPSPVVGNYGNLYPGLNLPLASQAVSGADLPMPPIPTSPLPAIALKVESQVQEVISQLQNELSNEPFTQSSASAPAPSSLPLAGTSLFTPGSELTLRVNLVIPPSAQNQTVTILQNPAPMQTLAPLTAPAPNQIVATVSGIGPGGQPILKAGDMTLFVRQTFNAPVGSQIVLTIEPAKQAAPAPLALTPQHEFSTLPQIIAALNQIDPALAQTIIENHIPQPGPALPGALLFLLSAFTQGDVRSFLGSKATDALMRAGKAGFIGKLTQDVQEAGQQPMHDTVVGEWRSYPLPLYQNGHFQTLTLYVHSDHGRHGEKDGKKPDTSHMRFLIDVRFSRLGAVQLDGFVQKRKLDMIVRSELPLPSQLPQELRLAYTNILSAVNYVGSLNFQIGKQHWLNFKKPSHGAALLT